MSFVRANDPGMSMERGNRRFGKPYLPQQIASKAFKRALARSLFSPCTLPSSNRFRCAYGPCFGGGLADKADSGHNRPIATTRSDGAWQPESEGA